MRGDGFFFLGLLLFIFVIWVASGGPSRPLSFAGPYLKPIQTSGVKAEAYGTLPDLELRTATGGVSGGIRDARDSLGELRDQVSEISASGEPSPYKGLITISHTTSGVRSNFSNREYVTLSAGSRLKEEVNISGWRLVSGATGAYGTIPNGISVPKSGSVNVAEPIIIKRGDKIIVNSGRAPTGISFRENTCIGYFEEFQDFSPALSSSCPAADRDFATFYPGNPQSDDGDECYEYVQDAYDRCQTATSTPRRLSATCRSFISTYVNYNGCVLMHAADDNFAGHTWRVFLGSRTHLWKDERETIKLLDLQGRIVDVFAY